MTESKALKKVITPEVLERMDRELCESINALIPEQINRLRVSTWAEENRILSPSVTPMPGPFRFSAVPYMREIVDCFSESSPIQKVIVMKGAQVSFTTAVLENVIGYIIAAAPGPSMFISADKGVAEASIELRVDAMIQSAGLAERIFAQVEKKHGKKTGDTKARKDFPGGFLMAVGPRVGSKLRSFPIRYLLGDELDAWPLEVGGGEKGKTAAEGDPLSLAEKRTVSFERLRKILLGSTPLIKQTSKIERLFQDGDQRYYFVPCPKCRTMQRLRWRDDEGNYRLKYQLDDQGRLVPGSVYYECENLECRARWTNEDKAWFLPRGEWRATATAREANMRSYHLSALYAPVGMRTWEDICREWVAVGDDVSRLRTFINTTLGESFEEKGWAPRPERIKARAEGYRAGELPESARPLVLTVGVDVQDDRLEAEVVAWGRDAESWSIEYAVFHADAEEGTSDLENKAWKQLREFIYAGHAGYRIGAAFVDEGGHRTEQVRLFCGTFDQNVYPVKGDSGGRVASGVKILSLRESPGHRVQTVVLNVDYLKEVLYSYLRRGTPDGKPPTKPFPGFCHFPVDYSDDYYRQLTAEERFLDRTRDGRPVIRWRKVHTRNEALDCRIYAMGVLYHGFEIEKRFWADRAQKANTEIIFSWADFWDLLERDHAEMLFAPKGGKG